MTKNIHSMSDNDHRTIVPSHHRTACGTTGLLLEEPSLLEQSVPGRRGVSLPRSDVPAFNPCEA
ncbi:MAG: hypothetical protein WC956_09170, partial [bacterium]